MFNSPDKASGRSFGCRKQGHSLCPNHRRFVEDICHMATIIDRQRIAISVQRPRISTLIDKRAKWLNQVINEIEGVEL